MDIDTKVLDYTLHSSSWNFETYTVWSSPLMQCHYHCHHFFHLIYLLLATPYQIVVLTCCRMA